MICPSHLSPLWRIPHVQSKVFALEELLWETAIICLRNTPQKQAFSKIYPRRLDGKLFLCLRFKGNFLLLLTLHFTRTMKWTWLLSFSWYFAILPSSLLFLIETSRIYTFCSAFATSCLDEISPNADQKTLPHLFQKFTSANVTTSPEGNASYKTCCSLPFCLTCFRLHS